MYTHHASVCLSACLSQTLAIVFALDERTGGAGEIKSYCNHLGPTATSCSLLQPAGVTWSLLQPRVRACIEYGDGLCSCLCKGLCRGLCRNLCTVLGPSRLVLGGLRGAEPQSRSHRQGTQNQPQAGHKAAATEQQPQSSSHRQATQQQPQAGSSQKKNPGGSQPGSSKS